MILEINVMAGLVAGVAAMVPGSIIYAPGVLGRRWMREIGLTSKQLKSRGSQGQALTMMLAVSLVNGLVVSLIANSIVIDTVMDAVYISLIVSWFLVANSLMLVFFEKRSATWLGISVLSHVTTAIVIGVVIGLFCAN